MSSPESAPVPSHFGGHCACGALVYECSAPPLFMITCHCRDCQRAGGNGHSPTVLAARASLRVTCGVTKFHEVTTASGNRGRREFCGDCGSPLFATSSGRPEFVSIRAGSLDDSSWFRPSAAVWTEQAQAWDAIDPALPKFPRGRPRPGT